MWSSTWRAAASRAAGGGPIGTFAQSGSPVAGTGGQVGFPYGSWPGDVVDLDGDLVPGGAECGGRGVDPVLLGVVVAAAADEDAGSRAPGEPAVGGLADDLVHPVAFRAAFDCGAIGVSVPDDDHGLASVVVGAGRVAVRPGVTIPC
jgi:hypothetical protein